MTENSTGPTSSLVVKVFEIDAVVRHEKLPVSSGTVKNHLNVGNIAGPSRSVVSVVVVIGDDEQREKTDAVKHGRSSEVVVIHS